MPLLYGNRSAGSAAEVLEGRGESDQLALIALYLVEIPEPLQKYDFSPEKRFVYSLIGIVDRTGRGGIPPFMI